MSYIANYIESGAGFRVERTGDGATFKPLSGSASDLRAFQSTVRALRDHEGDGYVIAAEHVDSDGPERLADMVVVKLEA